MIEQAEALHLQILDQKAKNEEPIEVGSPKESERSIRAERQASEANTAESVESGSLSETLSSSSMITCTESETTFSKTQSRDVSKSVATSKRSDRSHQMFVKSLFNE